MSYKNTLTGHRLVAPTFTEPYDEGDHRVDPIDTVENEVIADDQRPGVRPTSGRAGPSRG